MKRDAADGGSVLSDRQVALRIIAVLGLLFLFGGSAWRQALYERAVRDQLPPLLHVTRTVAIGGLDLLPDGCGAAVFQLAPETLQLLQEQGVAALHSARYGRGRRTWDQLYSDWHATPYRIAGNEMSLDDRWLFGLDSDCAVLPGQLSPAIERAIKAPGSFYATTKGGAGLILVPRLGIAVFAYQD